MRIQCDDDLYRVDRVYLGPRGRPWPFRATYRAWLLTVGLFVSFVAAWRALGIPWHPVAVVVVAGAAYWAAKGLDRVLTVDRPVSAELVRAAQEIVAPRPEEELEQVFACRLSVSRWPAGAPPDGRIWTRVKGKAGRAMERAGRVVLGRREGRVYVDGEWRHVR